MATQGRIELTPEQQLAELRRAHERYAALADRLKAGGIAGSEWRVRSEGDARRIAHAYEKSIASSSARMAAMGPPGSDTSRSGVMLAVGFFVIAAAGSAALVAIARPQIFPEAYRSVRAEITEWVLWMRPQVRRSVVPMPQAAPDVTVPLDAPSPDAAPNGAVPKPRPSANVMAPATKAVPAKAAPVNILPARRRPLRAPATVQETDPPGPRVQVVIDGPENPPAQTFAPIMPPALPVVPAQVSTPSQDAPAPLIPVRPSPLMPPTVETAPLPPVKSLPPPFP